MVKYSKMYLLPVVAFATVVNAILIVIELDLKPGDENPMEHHTGVNTISSDTRHRNTRTTFVILTVVGYCQGHTNQPPHLYQEGLQSLG